jgi:ubiquinone/menaquinone biosynthesis C-methylase UbiE
VNEQPSVPEARERASRLLDADHRARKGRAPQWDRLRRTLALLPDREGSLLDVGVGEGSWLELVARERPQMRLAALDLSRERLEDLGVRHADGSDIARHFGDVTAMPLADGSVDVVTLLEVVEHVPDWRAAVREALRVARRRVLITVPYREQLLDTVCVHCHQPTPLWGHLHSFDEGSFDELATGGRRTLALIPEPVERSAGLLRWIYRSLRPQAKWLGVRIDKV